MSSRAPLPPGWEECRTETGEIYYQDHNRGITQWERPAPIPLSERTPYRSAPVAPSAPTRARSPPLPSGWAKAWTPTGELYFIDHNTKTSHWEDPRRNLGHQKGGREPLIHGRPDPLASNRGMRVPTMQFEEQRRKEQELIHQRRELEAEKARLKAQIQMEEELRRKATELERHRLEIEREKMELAKIKSDLLRERYDPYARQSRAPPRSAPPRYGKEAPRYEEVVRPYPPAPRSAGPPPRYSEIRPPRPPPVGSAPPPRGAPKAVPFEPWVCAQCGTENRSNKFRCQTCSTQRVAEAPPVEVMPPPRGRDQPGGGAGGVKACRYGAECRRPDCKFGHPELMPAGRKPCRYGDECKNPKCTFAHLVLVTRTPGVCPPARPPRSGRRPIPTQQPPISEELQFPNSLSPELVEKVKELYREGFNVGQQNLELLGHIGVAEAMDCLDVALRDGDATEDPADRLKMLIEMQLTAAATSGDGEPAAKRSKTE